MLVQKNFSVLAYANGFTLWHYVSPDSEAEVMSPGYFDHNWDIVRTGDRIIVHLNGEKPAHLDLAVAERGDVPPRLSLVKLASA